MRLMMAIALAAWCWTDSTVLARRGDKPNIIFILADDLGYGDLGCYGQLNIQTPSLDRMAGQGLRFTQAYAGSTVCAPSRSVLMTGLHAGHTRIRGNARHPLQPGDVTVAEVLKRQGYQTALIGKWGLGEAGTTGHPRRQGFDYFFGYLNQRHAHNYYPTFLWRNEDKVFLPNVVPNEDAEGSGEASVKAVYSHDLLMAEALRYVRDHRDRRFFLYLALTIPHANNEAKVRGMEVPDQGPYRDLGWPAAQKNHAAMITRMDHDLGRLFAALSELGIDEETLVVFTSDNGPHREGGFKPDFSASSGPLRGIKRDLYEGGIRVPMLVRWPGKIKGGMVDATPWSFADVLPTLADLAGARIDGWLDGQSVAPVFFGRHPRSLEDRCLYWEFHEGGFKQAARRGPWKVVRPGLAQPLELYNLDTDAGETANVAGRHPAVAAMFEGYLKRARTESPLWPVIAPPAAPPDAPSLPPAKPAPSRLQKPAPRLPREAKPGPARK